MVKLIERFIEVYDGEVYWYIVIQRIAPILTSQEKIGCTRFGQFEAILFSGYRAGL